MKKRTNIFFITYSLIVIFYFLFKWMSLNDYKKCNGKILHIAGTSIPIIYNDGHGYGGGSGTNHYPYIEYYKDGDTLNATNKGWSKIFLNEGQEVTVLVNQYDKKDIKLYTPFNYWFHASTIILFIFLFFIGLGISKLSFKDFTEK